MILEIAIGVCLGVVLAALVLKYWRQLLASSVWLLIAAVVFGLLITVGILVWLNLEKIAIYVGAILLVVVLYGVPFWAYNKVSKKYPGFGLLLRGEAPWNTASRLPVRLVVMAVFAVAVAGLGIGAMMASVSLVDHIGTSINAK